MWECGKGKEKCEDGDGQDLQEKWVMLDLHGFREHRLGLCKNDAKLLN